MADLDRQPMRAPVVILILATALTVSCLGCDQSPDAAIVTTTEPVISRRPAAPTLSTLAPLLPNRQTHVACDAAGVVYWAQDAPPNGADLMFALGSDEVPQATALSVKRIAARAAASASTKGAMQSIACGADRAVYFFFNGGDGAKILVVLGRFDPVTADIQILADTASLRRSTGMGADLALTTGSLIPVNDGKQIWLWIHHSDGFRLLRFDVETATSAFRFDRPVELIAATTQSTPSSPSTQPASPLLLTDDSQRLSAGDDGALLLSDTPASMLRRIDANGRVTNLASLATISSALSTAAIDHRAGAPKGQILIFAGDGDPLRPRSAEQAVQAPLFMSVRYPAILTILPGGKSKAVSIDQFQFHSGFPTETAAFQQLVAAGEDSWIAFDAGSGELVRMSW